MDNQIETDSLENITLYDSEDNPRKPSEITLGEIYGSKTVIVDGRVYHNTDILGDLEDRDFFNLFGTFNLWNFNGMPVSELREKFMTLTMFNQDSEQFTVVLENGMPYIHASGEFDVTVFWKTIKALSEIGQTLSGYSEL